MRRDADRAQHLVAVAFAFESLRLAASAQTCEQETVGGYLWSPKRNKNGARNPFYECMREVAPGDLVLSFEGTRIRAS